MLRIFALWRNLLGRDRVERDLDDEMRAALHQLVAENIDRGMAPDAAHRDAMLQLGGIESLKQQVRDVRWGARIDTVLQDLRYASRVLRRNPMFTATAALSLAIGIGATTSIFTVANGLLLRAAPGVGDPRGLVDIVRTENGRVKFGDPTISYIEYLDIRRQTRMLSAVYGYELDLHPAGMAGPDGAERVFASIVTSNYFTALDVRAAAGRFFQARDGESEGSSPLVVLNHSFWTRRFKADPGIVGRALQINGQSLTVIGVAAKGFRGVSVLTPDLWVPAAASQVVQPGNYSLTNPKSTLQMAIGGRLQPGVSLAQASAELELIGQTLARERPVSPNPRPSISGPGIQDRATGTLGLSAAASAPIPPSLRIIAAGFLTLLMIIVSLLLVIACSNIAGVLLARATSRRREIAVRTAIGAGRSRLVRQLLTETLLLFCIGGASGIALARVMTSLLVSLLPAFPLPAHVSAPLDWRVVTFSLTLSLIAAVLCGIAPALHASRTDVVTALKDEAQGPLDRLRLRSAFVVLQVSFSLVLVVAAGLFGRQLQKTVQIDWGFEARGVEAVSLNLEMAGYTDASGPVFARALVERIRAIPGVEAATIADRLPEPPFRINGAVTVPGVTAADGQSMLTANWNSIEPGYFSALRIPLLAGRDFTDADTNGSQRVAIVDDATARRLWPGTDPIGQVLESAGMFGMLRSLGGAVGPRQSPERLVVVGVARSLRYDGSAEAPLVVYVPLRQRYTPSIAVLARTGGSDSVARQIRAAVTSMSARLPIVDARALDDRTDPNEQQLKIAASVAGAVGIVGLMLASIGVYGVTSYAVAQRTREIGIRLSLGARPADIVRAVTRRGMVLVALGSTIGLALAFAAGQVLSRSPMRLTPFDPLIFGGAAALFAVVGAIACYVPVRRATTTAALDALRYE